MPLCCSIWSTSPRICAHWLVRWHTSRATVGMWWGGVGGVRLQSLCLSPPAGSHLPLSLQPPQAQNAAQWTGWTMMEAATGSLARGSPGSRLRSTASWRMPTWWSSTPERSRWNHNLPKGRRKPWECKLWEAGSGWFSYFFLTQGRIQKQKSVPALGGSWWSSHSKRWEVISRSRGEG